MTRYYGDAARLLMQYRRRVDELRKNNGYVSWMPAVSDYSFIRNDDIVELQQLFDKAEAAVANDAVRFARVRHARAGLDRLNCHRRIVILGYGMEQKSETLDADDAYSRLQTTWKSWIDNWNCKDKDAMLADMDGELAHFAITEIPVKPVPKELEGKKFYDIYAPLLQNLGSSNSVSLVDDAESAIGKAMRSDADSSTHYSLPFAIGVYDSAARKEIANKIFKTPLDKGYNWYKFGRNVTLPKQGYIYMTRSWTTQLNTAPQEFNGKEFEIWVSVKFTGPKFFADEQGKSYIYIDRMALIVPDK